MNDLVFWILLTAYASLQQQTASVERSQAALAQVGREDVQVRTFRQF